MKLSDIPQLTQAHYHTNISLDMLEWSIQRYASKEEMGCPLVLEPEFQRGHVWTREQQIAYCEFIVRGGETGRTIIFNCKGWMKDFKGPMYLVDGLQRLTALRAMLKGDVPVFGSSFLSYEDHNRVARSISMTFQIGNLSSYADILKWYLEMNSGGTPHAQSEIDRVTALWEAEKSKQK